MNEHAMLAERLYMANPVPDPAEPPIGAIGADVVLLEIERRSTNVQTAERKTYDGKEPQRQRTGLWYAFAAFAAVIIIVVATVALFGTSSADDPVATTTTIQTTRTTLSVSEMEQSIVTEMGLPDGSVKRVAFGPVDIDFGAVPFSVVIPDWSSDYEKQPWLAQEPPGPSIWIGAPINNRNQEISRVGMLNFIDRRAGDEFARVVAEVADELGVTPTDTTIGGVPAVQFEIAEALTMQELESFGTTEIPGEEGEAAAWLITPDDPPTRFYIIDAPTGTFIAVVGMDPVEWETLEPYWEEILASIEFSN